MRKILSKNAKPNESQNYLCDCIVYVLFLCYAFLMTKKLTSRDLYPTESVRLYLDEEHPISKYELGLLKERLECFGVDIYCTNNRIDIWFEADKYRKAKTRNAGAKQIFPCKDLNGSLVPVTYADIVYWKYGCSKTWGEIAKLCNMSRATIFRQKKLWEHKLERYMRGIDHTRLDDWKYLQSIDGLSSIPF